MGEARGARGSRRARARTPGRLRAARQHSQGSVWAAGVVEWACESGSKGLTGQQRREGPAQLLGHQRERPGGFLFPGVIVRLGSQRWGGPGRRGEQLLSERDRDATPSLSCGDC